MIYSGSGSSQRLWEFRNWIWIQVKVPDPTITTVLRSRSRLELPVLRQLRSRFFGRPVPRAGSTSLWRFRLLLDLMGKQKIQVLRMYIICKHEVGSIYRNNMFQQWFLLIITAVLRSSHFFGPVRLRKSKVPEPTPAPTKLGRLRLRLKQKKAAPGGSILYHFSFWVLKKWIINA